MQIIIDIPDRIYKRQGYLNIIDSDILRNALKNGTPLPKGHGRLIDADAFGKELHRYTEAPYQYALKVFNDAPTIIKADISGKEIER